MALTITYTTASSYIGMSGGTVNFTLTGLTTGAGCVIQLVYGYNTGSNTAMTSPSLSTDGAAQSSSTLRESANAAHSVFYFFPNITTANQTFSVSNGGGYVEGRVFAWALAGHDTSDVFGNEAYDTDSDINVTVAAVGNGLIGCTYGSGASTATWNGGGTWGTPVDTQSYAANYSNTLIATSSGTVNVTFGGGHTATHADFVEIRAAGATAKPHYYYAQL